LLTAILPVSTVKADSVVVFPDPALDHQMRRKLSPTGQGFVGDIMQSYLDKLTTFSSTSDGIVDLTGMEHCTHLITLSITGSPITDLSPLSGLTGLTGLYLGQTQIGDISPLSGLTNLEELQLCYNQISDLSPLSGLTNLQQLLLIDNQVSDLSPLSGLTNLRALNLSNNQISDLTPLLNIPRIYRLFVLGNPLSCYSIDTVIPALTARGVEVDWDAGAVRIGGHIEDGYAHRLGGVEVTLMAVADDSSTTTRAVTIADDSGQYSFGTSTDTIEPGKYRIEVALECHKAVGDTATFSVHHDTGSPVRAQTDTFDFDGTCGQGVKNIDFVDPYVHPTTAIPADRLGDLAGMYYHTKQVIDFELKELGFTPDLNLPLEVHGYVTDNPSTTDMIESQTCYYDDGQVYIGSSDSDYDDDDRPMNREWHEMFHELMDEAVGFPPYHTGDENHDGYYNHCTGDSWLEGWANFWACALKRSLGADDWYCIWEDTSLEVNWQVWDFDDELSREEFAAASLLVDLVDPVSPLDMDYISLSIGQLWAIIGSQPLANMYEVHVALTAANIGQSDTNANGQPDLDDLFMAHGFFADGGDPGNRVYDAGEEVGWGGKPDRKNTIRVPNAYLRIIVADPKGNPITSGTLVVDVEFPSPLDIYNYSYEVDLNSSDRSVYFEVAPDRYDPLMKMWVRDGEGTLSDEFTLSNSEYWEKVSESATGYAAEHTFVIGAEGKATGGVPVWVWPIVGLAVVAAGVGGFFLLRRRAKPG
jgi:internalin A